MEELLKDLENLNSSLMGKTPQAAVEAQIPSRTVPQSSRPTPTVALPPSAAPIAKPGPRPLFASIAKPAQPNSHPGRKAVAVCAILAVVALAALGVVRRYNISALPIPADWARYLKLPAPALPASASPDVTANTQIPAAVPPKSSETPETPETRESLDAAQPSTPLAPSAPATPAADADTPADTPAESAPPPSRARICSASRGRSKRCGTKPRPTCGMAISTTPTNRLRDILSLPQVGPRWPDAAHYVDQVIPERRRDQQLWNAALFASTSPAPGHLLQEVKMLDELLASGGAHQKEARQMRDTAIAQLVLGSARKNSGSAPAASDADQWQMTRLKNHFDELVQQGDAAALDELQDLQSKFQSLADGPEPLATDARDYMNSVIPKARKHIEETLAAAESNSSANAAYTDAVKQYSRALAAQNSATLRDQVLPLFTQIAQSGGPRAKEAQRYVDVLIPAALKSSAQ